MLTNPVEVQPETPSTAPVQPRILYYTTQATQQHGKGCKPSGQPPGVVSESNTLVQASAAHHGPSHQQFSGCVDVGCTHVYNALAQLGAQTAQFLKSAGGFVDVNYLPSQDSWANTTVSHTSPRGPQSAVNSRKLVGSGPWVMPSCQLALSVLRG